MSNDESEAARKCQEISGEMRANTLAEALATRGLVLPPDQIAKLEAYALAVWRWNQKLNLTRHTTWDRFAGRDLIDSLALAGQLDRRERVLDVGSGGGVPGAVLAVVRPDLRVTLIDSVAKKARALEAILSEAGLEVPVVCDAAQKHVAHQRYDTLVVRAVAKLAKLLVWLAPHQRRFNRVLLIKGPGWIEERGEARHRGLLDDWTLRRLASYPMEGTDSESVILELKAKVAGEA